ncbi:hypothetical protein [Pyxidicoccus xibeiensis]|uniref:hypothetical protein n=1 Tax=Pyxidicoccus xibeiensis TaxID=2906759 RepID=UPI0020A737F7|nr:hypothetical protein [Pyxidicoccus xibeiensis]MCP3140365.1 hypothetical protein [Pyxidicoccus xibeiensis]
MDTPVSLDSCHTILKTALQASAPETWPLGPFALGGPRPVCPAVGQVELGLWFASLVAPLLRDKVEQAEARQVLEQVRGFLAERGRVPSEEWNRYAHGGTMQSRMGLMYQRLQACSESVRGESEALAVARRAAGAAASLCRGKDDVVFVHLNASVGRVVRLLEGAAGGALMPLRDFLAELDARILRLECSAAIAPLVPGGAVPDIAEVLWRGDGGKGRVLHFIARLSDGTYGLVTKLGRRWAWVHGNRDEVLASVPDTLFPEAARAVMKED